MAIPIGLALIKKQTQLNSKANVDSSGLINVKEFGAKGDASTDDTQAIQSAIDQAKTRTLTTIYLPVGTFRISKLNLTGISGLTFVGAGQNATTLQAFDGVGPILDLTGSHQIKLERFFA